MEPPSAAPNSRPFPIPEWYFPTVQCLDCCFDNTPSECRSDVAGCVACLLTATDGLRYIFINRHEGRKTHFSKWNCPKKGWFMNCVAFPGADWNVQSDRVNRLTKLKVYSGAREEIARSRVNVWQNPAPRHSFFRLENDWECSSMEKPSFWVKANNRKFDSVHLRSNSALMAPIATQRRSAHLCKLPIAWVDL